MMVSPKIPNFRLAIFLSAFFFFILSILSISSYLNTKDDKIFLEKERKLILNELSEIIDSYDSVEILNDSLRFQLKHTKERLALTIDSVKNIKPNEALISKFKIQIKRLKAEKEKILFLVQNLESENQSLKKERKAYKKILKTRDSITTLIETKYAHLLDKKEKDAEYKTLFISSLNAEGVKRITSKNRIVDTRYANRTKMFHVEFTIVKNKFLVKGPKTFYYQILDSKMNVIADKGTVNFGKKTLIYSGKKTVNYKGEEFVVSGIINKKEDEKLEAGAYYISVIHKGDIISKTEITLK